MPAAGRKARLLLLVESPDLGSILGLALGDYELEWHRRPEAAADAFRRRVFDLALVDLGFDGRPDGLDSIRAWRAAGAEFPIVAMSDLPRPSLPVESLDAGADDYLRKPFHHEELVLRIRKLLERRRPAFPELRRAGGVLLGRESFDFGPVLVTPSLTIQFPDGSEERIRPKQHGMLKVFRERAGSLVLKEELVRTVWGSDCNEDGHSVNEYLSTLRALFKRHGIDFGALVTNEPKAGWRAAASCAGSSCAAAGTP